MIVCFLLLGWLISKSLPIGFDWCISCAIGLFVATPVIDRLAHCSTAVCLWFLQNSLQLNADKSEVVFLDIAAQLRSAANITTVDAVRSTLPVAPQLKSLGVTIDSNLRFDCHARNVAKACNFHTSALRHVRSLLTDDIAQTDDISWTVACSSIASRLDYCNALLCGTPAMTFDKLQRTQNNSARIVCHCRGRTDARPLLRLLHGFQWGSGSSTMWLYWLTRCGPQPLRHISATWYRPTYQLRLFVHSTLCCWSFPRHRLNSLGALFLLQPHPSELLNCWH